MRFQCCRDVVLGLLFVLLGMVVVYGSFNIRVMPGMVVGMGLLPRWTGWGLVFFGTLLMINSVLVQRRTQIKGNACATEKIPDRADHWFKPLLLLALCLLIFLMPIFGFFITATIFSLFVVRLSGGSWLAALLFSPVVVFVIFTLFLYGLRVPLPVAFWT